MVGGRIAGLALIAFWLPFSAAFGGQVVKIVSDDSSPPYSYVLGGGAAGIYVEILQAVFARMPKYELQISPMPWKLAMQQTQAGEFLGAVGSYRRASRAWMTYSAPILKENVAVFCRKEIAQKVVGKVFPQGYAGLRFARNTGFKIGGDAFDAMAERNEITVEDVASTELNLRKLSAGRVDCYITDRNLMSWEWRRLTRVDASLKHSFTEVAQIAQEDTYLGLTSAGTFPFMADFVAEFNDRLEEFKAEGGIEKIMRQTFDQP